MSTSEKEDSKAQIGNKTSGFIVAGIGAIAFALIYQYIY